MNPPNKTEQGLKRVMVWGTAIAMGGMGAFLSSFRDLRDDPTLELSAKTVVAFLIGCAIGFLFWKGVDYLEAKNRNDRPDV